MLVLASSAAYCRRSSRRSTTCHPRFYHSSGVSTAAQRFKYDYDGRIVATNADLCLTVKDASTQPGAAVVMAPCAATTQLHQVWRLDDQGALRPKHMMWYPLCLRLNGSSTSAAVAPCKAGSDPTWSASTGQCCAPGGRRCTS